MQIHFPKFKLKPGKERSAHNFHPWIFSGAISFIDTNAEDGNIVEVNSSEGNFLGLGFYNKGSITVRLFSFDKVTPDYSFWKLKIEKAFVLRKNLGLTENINTNAYRLIHAEGDGIPGLIVDIYNSVAVIQSHNLGVHKIKPVVVSILKELYESKLTAIYDKSEDTMPEIPGLDIKNNYLFGSHENSIVKENNNSFHVDWVEGQKTGFFIDQRENRELVRKYSKGKTALNAFCYSGGFSIYALAGGASWVDSVDSSQKAIELTDKNIKLNQFEKRHASIKGDVLNYLKEMEESKYDLIILDPPAFAKHLKAINNAAQGYQKINYLAFQKIKSNGILFTFSCSQAIDKMLFRKIIFSAAAKAKRNIRILHQLSQPADHPINIYHPEGEYLKGLVLYVE